MTKYQQRKNCGEPHVTKTVEVPRAKRVVGFKENCVDKTTQPPFSALFKAQKPPISAVIFAIYERPNRFSQLFAKK